MTSFGGGFVVVSGSVVLAAVELVVEKALALFEPRSRPDSESFDTSSSTTGAGMAVSTVISSSKREPKVLSVSEWEE